MAGKKIEKIDVATLSDRAVVVITNTGQSAFMTEEGEITQGKSYQVSGKLAKLLAPYPGINIISVDGKEASEAKDRALKELAEKQKEVADAMNVLEVGQADLKAAQEELANAQENLGEGQKALVEKEDQLKKILSENVELWSRICKALKIEEPAELDQVLTAIDALENKVK